MFGLSLSRLNPWRFLFALVVLPCLIGADSARQNETLVVFKSSQLNSNPSATLAAVNVQYRLLRYADLQGQGPHPEQALFYTELFTILSQVSATLTFAKPQQTVFDAIHKQGIIRAPPVNA